MATFFCPSRQQIHTLTIVFKQPLVFKKPLYNSHLFTTLTFFCPQGGRFREVPLYNLKFYYLLIFMSHTTVGPISPFFSFLPLTSFLPFSTILPYYKRTQEKLQGLVPERPISINPGLKFCSVFVFYIPMHCLG